MIRALSIVALPELSTDGMLVMRVDPASSKAEEYFLRRQLGWRWK